MTYSIEILCTDRRPVTRREIADFVAAGVLLDKLTLKPPLESPESETGDWDEFEIYYEDAQVPVVVRRFAGPVVYSFREMVESTFSEHGLQCPHEIQQHLLATRQVFELQYDRDGLSDACRKMLDGLQSFLARARSGIIFSSDAGVYDANLSLILAFR